MKVTNQEKMNLTVEVFDFLHVAVSRALEVYGEIDHDEHGTLLTEVIDNLHQFVNRHENQVN